MNQKIQKVVIFTLLVSVAFGSILTSGVLQSTERIASSGVVVTPIITPPSGGGDDGGNDPTPEETIVIEIYNDFDCTDVLTQIVWGDIEVGSESHATVYVKNTGTLSTVISLSSTGWSPSTLQNYVTLDWDYNGQVVNPGEVIEITLSLFIDTNCPPTNTFSFDVVFNVS